MLSIYKIENTVNGKIYIGQTSQSISARWRNHISLAKRKGGCAYLSAAIGMYGESAFRVTQLFVSNDHSVIDEAEKRFIVLLGAMHPSGYNLPPGGERGTRGIKWREESRRRLSLTASKRKGTRLGMKNSLAHRLRISQTLMGHSVSEETRRRIKASMLASPKCRGFSQSERNIKARSVTG